MCRLNFAGLVLQYSLLHKNIKAGEQNRVKLFAREAPRRSKILPRLRRNMRKGLQSGKLPAALKLKAYSAKIHTKVPYVRSLSPVHRLRKKGSDMIDLEELPKESGYSSYFIFT